MLRLLQCDTTALHTNLILQRMTWLYLHESYAYLIIGLRSNDMQIWINLCMQLYLKFLKQLTLWCHVASVTPTTTLVTYPAVHKLCNSLLLRFISITKLGCQMLRLIPLSRTSIAFVIRSTIPTFSDQHRGSTQPYNTKLLSEMGPHNPKKHYCS